MSNFAFIAVSGEVQAFVKPGSMVGDVIAEAKRISDERFGLPVKFDLNGVKMDVNETRRRRARTGTTCARSTNPFREDYFFLKTPVALNVATSALITICRDGQSCSNVT